MQEASQGALSTPGGGRCFQARAGKAGVALPVIRARTGYLCFLAAAVCLLAVLVFALLFALVFVLVLAVLLFALLLVLLFVLALLLDLVLAVLLFLLLCRGAATLLLVLVLAL